MEKLDDLVASHLEDRLLHPSGWKPSLPPCSTGGRNAASASASTSPNSTSGAAEAELRLKRLYDAIEAGLADLDDPALKDRIDGLKVIRDQAKADAERAQAMLQHAGSQAVTPQMLTRFARTARERMRLPGGGCRRDHLRALAQRVEVAEGESRLLQALVANGSANVVPTQG